MSRIRLALRAIRLTIAGSRADPTPDYDAASGSYDEYFTGLMGRHSIGMLDHVGIQPGDDVIELACGTGHLTAEVARRLAGRGSLRVVDMSSGMLAVARGKVAPTAELDFTAVLGDMESYLGSCPANSADLIVIGWAICYSQPVRLLRDVARVLRPGGTVALIETRSDALAGLRSAFEEVVADDPSMLTAMIRVSLPKGPQTVGRWFAKAGLDPVLLREGEQQLPCTDGRQALEWVERSGAGAGFRDSFDADRQDEVRACLGRSIDRRVAQRGGIDLRHTFVVGVASAPAA